MSRSLKKGPYVDDKLLKKIAKIKRGDQQVIKTWKRNSTISPEMVGFKFGVHNGREHITILIAEDMVGHKLGEFVPTRKFIKHGGRMAREEEKQSTVSKAGNIKSPAPKDEKSTDKGSK